MRPDIDPVALGRRVRRVRLARSMTLKHIEGAVGVSATHVSEVERGKTSPTIGTLARIASALEVDVATLIEDDGTGRRLWVSTASSRPSLVLSGGDLVLKPCSAGDAVTELSLFEVIVAPTSAAEPRPQRAWGEEIVHAISGGVEVHTGEEVHALKPGDVLHAGSTGPLRFSNVTPETVRLIWATYPKYVF